MSWAAEPRPGIRVLERAVGGEAWTSVSIKAHTVPEMHHEGIQRNGQAQVEALVRLLLEPVGRKQRQKLVLEEEQERIETERREVHLWSETAVQDAREVMDALSEALLLLEKAQVAYRQVTPTVRRLLNQALFEGLLIRDEDGLEANRPRGQRRCAG